MDSYDLLRVMVDYDPDTGLFTWSNFTADELVEVGMPREAALAAVNSSRYVTGGIIVPIYVSSKAEYQSISYTVASHKIRILTGLAAWALATGHVPDGRKEVVLFIDGDVENTEACNLILASDGAAKLLTRNYTGIENRAVVYEDDTEGVQYRSVLRFQDGDVRRSVTGEWFATEDEAVKDRKQALIDNGLWTVQRLSSYTGAVA